MTRLWDKQAPARVKKASEAPQTAAKAPVKAKGTRAARKKPAAKKG